MARLSNKEKLILNFIITNCELYHLNESEAMTYIQYNFDRPISRRMYYSYKNRIYRDYEKGSMYSEALKRTHPKIFKRNCNVFLASDKIQMIRNGLKEKINLHKYDRLTFIPKCLKALQAIEPPSIERIEKDIKLLESGENSVNRFLISRPKNTCVREEYIKCGKTNCFTCPHGPYYYAYWKDNGKLRKKYLGILRPNYL